MSEDCPNRTCFSNTSEHQNEGISRRDLLKASAKAAAGLSILPLSYDIKVMASELLNNISPRGFILTNSAISYCEPPLLGDIDGDCDVDEEDLGIMASEWLNSTTSAMSNVDQTCYITDSTSDKICVDMEDYSALADDWRKVSSAISVKVDYCDPPLNGDVNEDCKVDEEDIRIMASEWLNSAVAAKSNLDSTCTGIRNSASSIICVDFEDYSILANDWLKCSSARSAISHINFRRPFGPQRRLA